MMKKVLLYLILAGVFGVSVANVAEPCKKNCKKDTYTSRNSENNRVLSYKKDGIIGRKGVAVATNAGAEKLIHKHVHPG